MAGKRSFNFPLIKKDKEKQVSYLHLPIMPLVSGDFHTEN